MSPKSSPEPKPSGTDRTFACEECVGVFFKTSAELEEHNKKMHAV